MARTRHDFTPCDHCGRPYGETPEADPPAELDDLLAEALPCCPPVDFERGVGVGERYCESFGHVGGCPARHRPALRRHLAAWFAAKGAEAEMLREAAVRFLGELRTNHLDMGGTRKSRYSMPPGRRSGEVVADLQDALARPRPSASGLLELLSTMRDRSEVVRADPRHALGEELSAILSDWSDALATAIGLPEEEDDG